MNKSKQIGLFGSGIWSMISLLAVALVGFITMPIIIREIGAASFGLYSIILMVGGFVALQDLGLGEATLKFVSKYYANDDIVGVNRVLGATLSVYLVTGTVFCISIITFAPQIVSLFKIAPDRYLEAVLSVRIASVGFLCITIATAIQKIPEAMLRYDVSSKVMLFLTLIHGILIVIVIKLGHGILGLISILVVKSILMLILYSFAAKRILPQLRILPNFNKNGIKEVFSYGVFSFLNQLIGSVSSYIDKLILGILLGTKEVAYLSAPKDVLDQAVSFVGAAGRALLVKFSILEDNQEESKKLYLDSNWILLTLTITVFLPLIIVLPNFLDLWISPEFSKMSSFVAKLIALGIIFRGVTHTYFSYLRGSGKVHWLTVMFFVSSGLSIVLSIILINLYGLTGAGLRILIMSFSSILLWVFVLKKALNTNSIVGDFLRSIGLPFAIGVMDFSVLYFTWQNVQLTGWFFLIAGYSLIALITGSTIFLSDLFVYRKNGAAYLLYQKLRSVLKRS